ncbi:hypothetical protein [Aeromonas veronii]|uniref:hypothetical protein n=1 Tax=Aeromonas veronii TaxID=654 RepID=UPI003B9EBA8F
MTRNEIHVSIVERDLRMLAPEIMSYRELLKFIINKSAPINMICPAVNRMIDAGKIVVDGLKYSEITGALNERLKLPRKP